MLSFTFPYRLKSEANIREHWSAKHRRHKKERLFLHLALKKIECQLPCRVHLTRIAPRSFDHDNLLSAFKNFRDIIADLLIPGLPSGHADSDERISWHYFQEKGKPKEYAVRIEIIEHNTFDMAHTTRQIEEIIHDSKKLLDFPSDSLSQMPREDQIAWYEKASARLNELKDILNIPPVNIPYSFDRPTF